MGKLDAVVVGGAAVDLVAQVDELPQRDSLVLARAFERFPGGSAANVAVGLARLGRRVGFVGKLGDDEHGQLLLAASSWKPAVRPLPASSPWTAGASG